MNLSILIPNLNCNVLKLVNDIHSQCIANGIRFEILVVDDGSRREVYDSYQHIRDMEYVGLTRNELSKGRSVVRNFLVRNAHANWLLFIDADAEIQDSDFIDSYLLTLKKADVVSGGIVYQPEPPDTESTLLRWRYGRKFEVRSAHQRNKHPYGSFSSFNFCIRKEIMEQLSFDDSLLDYGHEDTLLGLELKRSNATILHVDNALSHTGLEPNDTFLLKTRSGLENLYFLTRRDEYRDELFKEVRLLRYFKSLRSIGLIGMANWLFRRTRKEMEKNLFGNDPSVYLFQLYKLGYFINFYLVKQSEKE